MSHFPKLPLLLITGLTAVLRARGLFANSFQADEALFATWAREIAIWRDPLLAMQPVDKPPLLFYLQAMFYPLFGPVEIAARWPNWIASLLLVPLVGVLVWKLYRRADTAVFAAAFIALFPLAIQFSGTAFTDPMLTVWLVASLTAVSTEKPGWAGILFGLALLTKYQAILFLPLLLGFGWVYRWRAREGIRWLVGFFPPLIALFAWETARTGTFLLWQNQISNFGGVRLTHSWEIWPRFWAWIDLWETAVSPFIFYLLILAVIWFLFSHLRSPETCQVSLTGSGIDGARPDRSTQADRLLLIFTLGYLLLHWLLAIPVWDRYLLPMMPLIAILLARAFTDLVAQLPRLTPIYQFSGALVILTLLVISGSWSAMNGRTQLGSFPQADQGAAEVATALADAPYGTVLYDHWFSWQWRYHLFDKRVFVSWFPHGDALVADLIAFGNDGSPRYLALPKTAVAQPIIRSVENADFMLTAVAQSDQIILYEVKSQITQISKIDIKNLSNLRNLWLKSWSNYAVA